MTADRKPLKDITAVTEAIMAEHTSYTGNKESVTEYINACVTEVVKLKMYIDIVGSSILGSNPPRNGIELAVNGPKKLWLTVESRNGKDFAVFYETREGTHKAYVSEPTCDKTELNKAIDSFPSILDAGMAVYVFQQHALKEAKTRAADMKIKADNISSTKKRIYKEMADSYKALYEEFNKRYESA